MVRTKKSILVVAAVIPLVVIGAAAVWQTSGDGARRIAAISSSSEPVVLSWRGAWDPEAQYTPGQVVSLEGSSYVAESEVSRTRPGGRRCGDDCPWTLLSSAPTGGRDVRAALLDANNRSTTLYEFEGIGRIEVDCQLTSPERVTWRYTNTLNQDRFFSWQAVLAVGYAGSSGVLRAGQGVGSAGDTFADRLLVYPLEAAAGTAPYIDVFLSGAVIWSQPSGQATSCQVRGIAVTG